MLGSGEPKRVVLDPSLVSWGRTKRMELSEGRLRADVTSLLGPHSRLASPDLMDRFGQTLHGAFEEAGWPVEEQSYTLRGVRGSLDYGEG